jgi:hypothetical protein
MSNNETSTVPQESDPEFPPLTPDQQLDLDLTAAFSIFTERQREIRRLARYLQERADDIDDLKIRAKELIEEQIHAVNEKALDELMQMLIRTFNQAVDEEDLSADERVELLQSTFKAVAEDLPDGALSSYIGSITRVTLGQPATPMLLGSLLVTLVGELETLVGAVTRALYSRQPEKLNELNKSYSWSEIERFETIAEMREHVADHTVEKMLYGSFSEWFDVLDKRFGVPRPARSQEFQTLEVIQRRHLMVHSGGVVSRQYLDNLKQFSVESQLHDQLTVNYEYLDEATDCLFVVALSLVAGATFKVVKDPEIRKTMEERIANASYFLLQEKRYDTVVTVVSNLSLSRMSDEMSRHITQVNGWIALKQLGRFQECRKEVEAFDVSARSNNLRLAKYALLDEVETAHKLARNMLETKELPAEHWLAWPLLEGVRAYHDRLTSEEPHSASAPENDYGVDEPATAPHGEE